MKLVFCFAVVVVGVTFFTRILVLPDYTLQQKALATIPFIPSLLLAYWFLRLWRQR